MNFLKRLFGIKEKSAAPYVPRKGSVSLNVYFKDGRAWGWSVPVDTPLDNEKEYFDYYKDFRDWWEKPKDEFMIMQFKGGEQMFLHSDIKRYEISYVVPEVVKYSDNVIPLKNGQGT